MPIPRGATKATKATKAGAEAEAAPEQAPERPSAPSAPSAGPENLSLDEFKAAARRGVVGPADRDNPDFARIDREPIEPRGTPKTQVWHRDVGMNYGYSVDDIARHQAHTWALERDRQYNEAYTRWLKKQEGAPPPIRASC